MLTYPQYMRRRKQLQDAYNKSPASFSKLRILGENLEVLANETSPQLAQRGEEVYQKATYAWQAVENLAIALDRAQDYEAAIRIRGLRSRIHELSGI
jgi:hypothetical protein